MMDDKSILDIVEENFKAMERRNYVHRIIYAADHSLRGDDPKITDILKKNIQRVNEEYCDEPLTGFCLNYNRHFIHLLDGSEHSIMKHLKSLIECKQLKDKLGRMKLLVIYNHINQRFFSKWGIRTTVPPTLLGQLNQNNDFEAISDYVRAFIIKMYNLATHLYNTSSPHHHHPHHHHGEISYHPPPEHHHGGEISYTPPPGYGYESNDFELSGPGLGAQYIAGNSIHRNAYEHRPSMYRDATEIKSWGLAGVSSGIQTGDIKKSASGKVIPQKSGPLTSQQIEELAARAEKEVMLRVKLQQEQLRIQQENARLREQLRHQEMLKLQAHQKLNDQMKYPPSMIDQQQKLFALHQQQKMYQPQIQQKSTQQQKPIPSIVMPASKAYDPFYSPILEKVDAIFAKMSVNTEGCKERLVCSMYKNPAKFSPHSNLISNELSRDSKELQKPTSNNVDVIRFYKYIQAARDGQEKKDCLKIYPACLVNTEK